MNKKRHYVRGHFRRNSRKYKAGKYNWQLILGILFLVFMYTIIENYWYILTIPIGIGLAIYLIPKVLQWRYDKEQNPYSIEHHCDNCGRMNTFHYSYGSKTGGVTVICHYCGHSYIR